MSGTSNPVERVPAGDARFGGLLWGTRWAGAEILYAFPDSASAYDYDAGTPLLGTDRIEIAHERYLNRFASLTEAQKTAVAFALDADAGRIASAGFSVEGFTRLGITEQTTTDDGRHAQLRFANTRSESLETAEVADFPGGNLTATRDDDGDIWFGPNYGKYLYPKAGTYGWATHLHEIGHGLGLKHPHDDAGWLRIVAEEWDWLEYSVMSYRSHENDDVEGSYVNEYGGFPQTFMMNDIAALQYLYGANYEINAGDTVYSWRPWSGTTMVDGKVAIEPESNRIFATIWDGGGTDTYDLGTYRSDLSLDLRQGRASRFDSSQLARLSEWWDIRAAGNIYNALRHENDDRSLIENAIGGHGDDLIVGNWGANQLTGGGGRDDLSGLWGDDSFRYAGDVAGADGSDYLYGGEGVDRILLEGRGRFDLSGLTAWSIEVIRFADGPGEDKRLLLSSATFDASPGFDEMIVRGNSDPDGFDTLVIEVQPGSGASLSLNGWAFEEWQGGRDAIVLRGDATANTIVGSAEDDRIEGRSGDDRLFGGQGQDSLLGGWGADMLGGSIGNDDLDGGGADDALWGGAGQDRLRGGWGADTLGGGAGNDDLDGGGGADRLWGGAGQDLLRGGWGADTLGGGPGDDILDGGGGADLFWGGGGRDVFRFGDLSDSRPDAMDVVADFDPAVDRIDLAALDARHATDRDDAFTFLGVASMQDILDAGPGILWLESDGVDTVLMANVDRNAAADFALLLEDGRRTAEDYDETTFLI